MRGEPQNPASLGEREATVALADLGTFLISQRKELGWTQQELARRLGVYLEAVCRMERTQYQTVSLARLIGIAQAFGIRVQISAEPTSSPIETMVRD